MRFQPEVAEKIGTHFMFSDFFFSKIARRCGRI